MCADAMAASLLTAATRMTLYFLVVVVHVVVTVGRDSISLHICILYGMTKMRYLVPL